MWQSGAARPPAAVDEPRIVLRVHVRLLHQPAPHHFEFHFPNIVAIQSQLEIL